MDFKDEATPNNNVFLYKTAKFYISNLHKMKQEMFMYNCGMSLFSNWAYNLGPGPWSCEVLAYFWWLIT